MKLQTRILLIIGIVFITSFIAMEYFHYRSVKNEVVNELRRDAKSIRSILMATRRVYHFQFLDSGLPLTDKTLGFLPAHALSRISEDFKNWTKDGLSFNNVSDRPRNPNNAADSIEKEAISFFRDNPTEKERFVSFKSEEDELCYHYTAPIWVEEYCLKCHGKRENAPITIRTMYGTAFDYKLGELRGIMSIKLPAKHIQARIWVDFRQNLWIHLASFSGMFILVSWLLGRYITAPVVRLTKGLKLVASGNFDQPIEGLSGEMAVLGDTFNKMSRQLTQREDALKESEAKYRQVHATSLDGIIIASTEDKIIEVNRQVEKIFGYESGELVGQELIEIIPEHLRERHLNGIKRVIETGKTKFQGRILELEGLRRNGELFPIELTINNFVVNKKTFFTGTIRDITERKIAEEELKKSYQELKETQKASLNIMEDLDRNRNELDKSLKEKEVLLKEVHHRVKNNMQIISSLLKLQAGNLKDEQLIEILKESQSRIKAMSLIHEKLYRSENIASIDFNEYIKNLTNDLFRFYNISTAKVTLKRDISDVFLNIDTAIPCGLIINEFVSNSLKYAFPDNKEGEIKISLHKIEESRTREGVEFELILSDNGKGIPEDIDYRNTESLGLRLIYNLTEHQLGGKIELDRSKGTEFRICFKEKKYKERI